MRLLLVCLALVTFLCADEMQRIEAIVNDITKLRVDYNECKAQLKSKKTDIKKVKKTDCSRYKKELKKYKYATKKYKSATKKYKKLFKKEKLKNSALTKKMSSMADLNIDLDKQIDSSKAQDVTYLQREIKKYRVLLKIRENKIKELKNKICSTNQVSAVVKDVESSNKFPKLAMKKEYKNEAKIFKAHSFRLKDKSKIFETPKGKIVTNWDKGISFTSNQKQDGWIKITGYFVNKKWKKAKKEMWVKEEKTLQR